VGVAADSVYEYGLLECFTGYIQLNAAAAAGAAAPIAWFARNPAYNWNQLFFV
jgi:hypothetical protein